MVLELSFLVTLILLNGVFAMSEIAIVSSRRARLAQMAQHGSAGAVHALTLSNDLTRFLSSVQVGITSIGILTGALGEATIARRVQTVLQQVPGVAPHAEALSLALMVVGLTYVSLILGELVPKRLALTRPEMVATLIARPMQWLATLLRPLVYVLSLSTDTVLRVAGVRSVKQPLVTLEEIKILIDQGTQEGVFERSERDMVTNVLNLDERRVGSVLTPRSGVVFLDVRDSLAANREKLRAEAHTVLPLCDGGLDRVLGFVRSTRVVAQLLDGQRMDLSALVEPPLYVPETMTLMTLLEQFKRMHLPLALVIDEFGGVEGLVSLTDVVSSIVGDLPPGPGEDPMIVYREDGGWLMDGSVDLLLVCRTLGTGPLVSEKDRQHAHTVSGLAMLALGRVPRTGDVFEKGEFTFEIVDMDGHRVDRVLVSRQITPR